MVAATLLRGQDGRFAEALVAVGAASETARRLPMLEQALKTLSPDRRPSSILRHEHIAPLSPINDGRASASYRRDAAYALIASVLDKAAGFETAHA
jgi:CO/xanthine dehydrogenase FAD-binding subunit